MTAALAALASALPAIAFLVLAGWLTSLMLGNVSIVDSIWPLFFVFAGCAYLSGTEMVADRGMLVGLLVLLWAARLGIHITARNTGEPEDHRYQSLREKHRPFHWKSLYVVFGLQGLLAWMISWPLLSALTSGARLGLLDAAALLLWLLGMTFEVVGDWQLARFRRNPENAGRVLDHGLWRFTRHPNYFGEFCIWWAYYLFAVAAGGWWTVVSPVLMTFLLLRVSGVALLERTIEARRPAYRAYVERTNAFFPGPPEAVSTGDEEGVAR